MKQILVELRGDWAFAVQMEPIAREWASGAYRCLLIHVYSGLSGEENTSRVAQSLKGLFPEALVVGSMSAGEICNGKLMEPGVLIAAMLFQQTEVRVLRYDRVKGREEETGRQIRRDLEDIPGIRGAELLFPGTELNTQGFFRELSLCRRELPLWGGYSGGHRFYSPDHFIFDPSGVMYDSVLVTAFAGEALHIDIDKIIGWEPLGLPFHVTKAEGNRLIELDGRPASELYEKFLRIDRSRRDNAQEGYTFPFLAKHKGEEWLRSTIHIEEDGSLDLHGFVMEGMEIQLSYGNPATIIHKVNQRLEALRAFRPQAILLYSCVVRKAFWDTIVNLEMEPFAALCSAGGFHTWGEVCRSQETGEVLEHNVTLLTIALREGDAPREELPPVQVDETLLEGQGTMLRRLSSLIYTTMGELQKAHTRLQLLNEKLTIMAECDRLTGLNNRGKTEELIEEALKSCDEEHPTSLIMVDADHFKRVNDIFGHQTGDEVLQQIAELLQDAADERGGFAGRWGGEEFFLVLPGTPEQEAAAAAEALRRRVEDHVFPEVEHMTVSLGVICVQSRVDPKRVYTKVDNALYMAKTEGRNRCVLARL